MPEFGDELIIESYKVPWLIWIQLLVTILLIFLLFFGFTIFTSDSSSSSSAASPSTGSAPAPPTNLQNGTSSSLRTTKTSEESVIVEDQSGEESSLKDPLFFRIFQHPNHPCNYIRLVKRAFFKCFGLDCSSESSSSHQHEKQE